MGKVTRKRHFAKTITWRIAATLTTISLAWFISGDYEIGLKVGLFEFFIKMVLYYFHERIWYQSKFGIKQEENE